MEASAEDTIKVDEARKAIAAEGAQVIDIRDKEAWLDGHVPGSLHAAAEQLEIRIEELSEDKPVIVVGDDDDQSAEVAGSLRGQGFEARVMKGGMKAWKDENFTLQPSEDPDLEGDFDPSEEGAEPAG
jgi:rhodanese-related sulfurtransferase